MTKTTTDSLDLCAHEVTIWANRVLRRDYDGKDTPAEATRLASEALHLVAQLKAQTTVLTP